MWRVEREQVQLYRDSISTDVEKKLNGRLMRMGRQIHLYVRLCVIATCGTVVELRLLENKKKKIKKHTKIIFFSKSHTINIKLKVLLNLSYFLQWFNLISKFCIHLFLKKEVFFFFTVLNSFEEKVIIRFYLFTFIYIMKLA